MGSAIHTVGYLSGRRIARLYERLAATQVTIELRKVLVDNKNI